MKTPDQMFSILQRFAVDGLKEQRNTDAALFSLENEIKAHLPSDYRWFLQHYGAVYFEGLAYSSREPSPWASDNGLESLDYLFGLGGSELNILDELKMFQNVGPEGFLPIGGSEGGNLVCVDLREAGQIYTWDHEAGSVFLAAASFSDFLDTWLDDPSEPDPKVKDFWLSDDLLPE